MSITAGSLYRDMGNFLRYKLIAIIIISLLTSFITIAIGYTLTPSTEQLALLDYDSSSSAISLIEMIQNMTPEQRRILLRASAAGTISSLVGNTLLLGAMLCLIQLVSARQRISVAIAIDFLVPLLPYLLLLTFLITLVVQLGFILLIVPGLILGIMLSLAPIILSVEKTSIIAAIRASFHFARVHIRLITPAVMVWLLAKILLLLLTISFNILSVNAILVLLNALGNLVSAILVIYLFRLYMLIRSGI